MMYESEKVAALKTRTINRENLHSVSCLSVDIDDAKMENYVGNDKNKNKLEIEKVKQLIKCFGYQIIRYNEIKQSVIDKTATSLKENRKGKGGTKSVCVRGRSRISSVSKNCRNDIPSLSRIFDFGDGLLNLFEECKKHNELFIIDFLYVYCGLKLCANNLDCVIANRKKQKRIVDTYLEKRKRTLNKNLIGKVAALVDDENQGGNENEMNMMNDSETDEDDNDNDDDECMVRPIERICSNVTDINQNLDDSKDHRDTVDPFTCEAQAETMTTLKENEHLSRQIRNKMDRYFYTTSNTSETRNDQRSKNIIERSYSFAVETLSILDLVTDIIILEQLYNGHTLETRWLTVITSCLLLAPYLVSYSVLGWLIQFRLSSFLENLHNRKKRDVRKLKVCKYSFEWDLIAMNIICFFLMTPLNIIYFFSIDSFFIIYIICSNLGALCNCSQKIENLIDEYVFQKFFQMNRVQVVGYRRLRTLSQLLFEVCTIQDSFLFLFL